jgi:hypothetical protein
MKIKALTGKESYKLIPFYLFFLFLTLAASGNFFFWDTVQLASKHAQWYFDNNFDHFLLPDSIDSGHIPSFGLLLAMVWKIFNKSLLVSHLFMLPFLLGIVYQAYQIISYFFSRKHVFYVLILFLLDPTLLSQSILVSPDIVLIFFFLFSLNMILHNNRKWLLPGMAGLALISMRGMILVLVLLVFDLYVNLKKCKGNHWLFKIFICMQVYIPAMMVTLGYLTYHYLAKGWIGYHDSSPWALSFEKVGFTGFLFNIGILSWRLIDFGRIILWLVFVGLIIANNKKIKFTNQLNMLIVLLMALMILLPFSMLLHKHLLAHRYLLPIYLMFALLVCYIVFEQIDNPKLRKALFIIMTLGLITGNFWVYPDNIAKGWDATLAHVPYYSLRNKMIDYIDQRGIPYREIGTAFPNISSFKYIDLTDNPQAFVEKDLSGNKYIFYSNIMNDFTDKELCKLHNEWIVEKEFRSMQVYVILYRNPTISLSPLPVYPK